MFKTLTAYSSRKSKLNQAMAEALEDRNLVADTSVETELDPAAACVKCKVHAVSFKLLSAILIADKKRIRLTSDLSRRQQLVNEPSPQMWPTMMTLAG